MMFTITGPRRVRPSGNKASDEQEQTAADLNTCDGVNVATAKECADELAGQTLHCRHWNKVQEGVGPEDSEHEPEKDSHDDDGVFHNFLSPNHLDLPIKFFFPSRSLRNGKRSVKPKSHQAMQPKRFVTSFAI